MLILFPMPPSPSSLDAALREIARGHQPVSIPLGSKGPKTPEWHRIRYSSATAPTAFGPGKNIGLLVGAPSNGLVDVDLDCAEAAAVAALTLPPTGMTHGRPAAPMTHRWYRVTTPWPSAQQFRDPVDDKMLVELRSSDGTKGVQTVIPPSVHPDGERYAWDSDGEPARIDETALLHGVQYVAAAAMMARNFPKEGRHKFALALAGGLLRRGWDVDRTHDFIHHVCEAGGSEDPDTRAAVAEYTQSRIDANQPATGFNTLADMLGKNGTFIVLRLHEWLHLEDAESGGWKEENLTELGVAERLARLHSSTLFYVPERGDWFSWVGNRWQKDSESRITGYATATIRAIGEEAQKTLDTIPDKLREVVAWRASAKKEEALEGFDAAQIDACALAIKARNFALMMETNAKIAAVVSLAKTLPALVKKVVDLDADPWLFNVQNGTLDLRTGALRSHAPTDYQTKLSPVAYDPAAKAPRFLRFLHQVLPDPALRDYVQRAHGYSLTGLTNEQCLFMCIGTGANGKSVLDKLRRAYMGEYSKVADASAFLVKRADTVRNDIAALVGARMVCVSEINRGRALEEAQVKSATSGDTIAARFLYKEMFEFVPQFKLWMSSNYRPKIEGTDDGIWRRIRLVPFDVTIADEKQDKDLDRNLIAEELSGVLRWAVEGCLKWQKDGLNQPPAMLEARADYRENYDPLGEWFDACCTISSVGEVASSTLYGSYKSYCSRQGVEYLAAPAFGELLPHKGCKTKRFYVGEGATRRQVRGWAGVELKAGALSQRVLQVVEK